MYQPGGQEEEQAGRRAGRGAGKKEEQAVTNRQARRGAGRQEEEQAEKTKLNLHLCCSSVSALTVKQSAKAVHITTMELALHCTPEDRN